jgi:uncharacterized protein (DUF302 family)
MRGAGGAAHGFRVRELPGAVELACASHHPVPGMCNTVLPGHQGATTMNDLRYGFERTLGRIEIDEAERRVTEALKTEGFGVLTRIDVKDTFKRKLDADFRPYVILGACNPQLARRALDAEPQIGLLLPCNVVVQKDETGDAVVSIADPKAMFTLVDNPAVGPVASEVEARLRRVIDALGGGGS